MALLTHARQTPDKPAYVIGDGEFIETYGELEQRSRSAAHWLRSLGLVEGDSVAVLLGNIEEFFDIYWATQRIGLYLTPINWHLNAEEISYIIGNCEADVVVVSESAKAMAEKIRAATEGSVRFYFSVGGDVDGYQRWENGVSTIDADLPLSNQRWGSVMVYSSGTTGRPKGIRKPLPGCGFEDDAYTQAQTRFVSLFGFVEGDAYLCPAPLYHAAPARSCAATQVLGGTVYVMRRFDAEEALRIIDHCGIQVSQWVPTHFKRLLSLPEDVRSRYNVSSLRVAVHAAAPCPMALKEAMIDWWGPVLTEYYAGTEGGGTVIRADEWLSHKGSVGRPWKGVDLAILDSHNRLSSERGVSGPIYFRDNLAPAFHYFKDPEKTADVFIDNWFTLGDIGYIDEEGYLYLTDRQSNMIISGGVNIYPQEVEDTLLAHPKVYDAAVIGVPCEEMGEQVKAVVIPAEGIRPDDVLADELISYCRERIAHYKAPKSVDFVTRLPRTETGKLQKKKLRAAYAAK